MTMAENKKQIQGIQGEDTRFLTVKETAAHLSLCEKQIRRLIKKGDLVAYRFGGAIRISKKDIEAYMAGRRVSNV